MKNYNVILFKTNSFFRTVLIALCLMIVGVGEMWADEITVYTTGEIFNGTGDDAWDNDASTISVDLRYGHPECYDCDGFNGYYNAAMTKTAYTYNGYPIYSYTLDKAAAQFRFKHFKNSVWKENYTADWHSTTGQIYRGHWDDAHHWVTYGRDITIYAVPESMDGYKWTEGNTLKAVFKYGDQESEKTDKITWTKTDYTYEGNYIYKCTFLVPYNVIKKINFYYNDGSDKDLYEIAWNDATQYGTDDIDGKIFLGWKNESHTWVTYGRDITVYTVPETLFSDGEKYTTPFSTSTHTLKCNFKYGSAGGEWVDPMPVMTKTDWKYNNATIYKVTMLAKYNVVKQMAFQYFNGGSYINEYHYSNNYTDLSDVSAADVDGKIYTGYSESAHHWESYATDITLDKQNGSDGTSSITATVGSAMPAITLPTRVGYAFGGYYSEEDGGGTQYYNFDGSSANNWVKDGPTTLYAKWIAVTLSTPTVLASGSAYLGEDITINLSTTSTYIPDPLVIFFVTDNSNSITYEVVATPGAIGDAPTYSTTHTATFTAKHAATYSVTANVYSGKLIDNFDGALAHWKALGNGSGTDATIDTGADNPAIQAGNGSNTVLKITRGDANWKTAQTKKAANDATTTNWNLDYGYIYMSMYSTSARTPKIKYSDDDSGYEVALGTNSLSDNTWQRKQFATTHNIDYILPFIEENTGDVLYIDDIILSNESSMTSQATSSSASTTITQPTIGSCTASAASTHWAGSNINISLSAQTTYLADAVVVFFVTDGSNSTTYEVTATPGTPGANNAITHTATFVAQHAATYSVTAKLYNGKLIDNFDGSMAHWKALEDGSFDADEANPERETTNGSSKVMKITRGAADWKTVQTKVSEESSTTTNWNYNYGYIYMSMYSTSARTPKLKYSDDGSGYEVALGTNSLSANTWQRKQFATTHDIDYILPFMPADGTMYIDDIILSNRSSWAPIQNTSGVALTASASDVAISDKYNVTLHTNSGTINSGDVTTYTYGTGATLPTDITRPAYHFLGWYANSGLTGDAVTAISSSDSGDKEYWAKWETRYALMGSRNTLEGETEGMPGWTPKSILPDFTVESFTDPGDGYDKTADLRCVRTLLPNRSYKFQVYDREQGYLYGTSDASAQVTLEAEASVKLNSSWDEVAANHNRDVIIYTVGYGDYTFKITGIDKDGYPTITVLRPSSYQSNFGTYYADGSGTLHQGTIGGTISVQSTEGGNNYTLASGNYVAAGGSITYTATPEPGYDFVGWFGSSECTGKPFNTDLSWTHSSLAATSNSYAKFVPATLTFTGAKGYEWNDTRNWTPACIPTIDHDVILQSNAVLYGRFGGVSGHGRAKSIKIDKSVEERKNIRLSIWTCSSLIVAEDIKAKHEGDADYGAVNAEDLYIETTVLGNGVLICGSANANTAATYDFHSKAYKADSKWYINQYVGIPFAELDADKMRGFNIFVYDDAEDDWRTPGSKTMNPWTAYDLLCIYPGGVGNQELKGTLLFPGTGAGKTKTLSPTRRDPEDDGKWTVSHPFPTSIDEKSGHQDHMFANSWTAPIEIAAMEESDFTHLVHTIYIFNAGYEGEGAKKIGDDAGQWSSFPLASVQSGVIENAVIPGTQAFLVTDTASEASLTLDYKKHVYDPAKASSDANDTINNFPTRAPRRIKKDASLNSLKMFVRSEEDVIADRLYIIEGSNLRTDTFDNGWDGNKIMGESFAPQLYAMSDGSKMAVNAVKDMEGVKIGFKAGTSAQDYTLSFDYEEQAQPLYLYDNETNAYTEITNDATYSFTTDDTKAHERFLLTRSNSPQIATGVEEIDTENVQRAEKFMQDQQIFIRRGEKIYSMDGALVK